MPKSLLKLEVHRLSYRQLLDLGNAVVLALTAAAATYPAPNPPLASVSTDLSALGDAITAWGPQGNRGSKQDLILLREARDVVRVCLTQLANYCENTTPYDRAKLATTGFPLKKE